MDGEGNVADTSPQARTTWTSLRPSTRVAHCAAHESQPEPELAWRRFLPRLAQRRRKRPLDEGISPRLSRCFTQADHPPAHRREKIRMENSCAGLFLCEPEASPVSR